MDFTWVTTDDANAIQNSIVDAKGDLISATANDTPARLAVGANGETLVADSSASTGLRYNPQNALVNPVIGGGFDIWQRGTSFAVASATGTYTADRWQVYRGAAGTTISRQVTGDTTNLPNVQYCARVQRNSGNTATNDIYLMNNFESVNSIPYAGKAVTISLYARKGADYSMTSSNLSVIVASGTGTDQNFIGGYTGQTVIVNSTATLTTTWQRFAFTGTVPATATELGIQLGFVPVGTAGVNDYFEVTGVQIDLGTYTASTAPTFRRAGGTLQGELAACQRYYWRSTAENSYSRFTEFNTANSATTMFLVLRNPVRMRVKPSSIEYSTLQGYDGSSLLGAVSALTLGGDATNDWTVLTAILSGMTQFRPTQLIANNSTSAYLGLSAEL
jgi:hypothetical protein